MKKAVLSLFLIRSLAFGAEPSDAPVVCGSKLSDLDAPGCATELKQGEPAPYAGVLLDEQENVRRTRDRAGKTGTLDSAEQKNVLMPKGTLAVLITGIIVITAGATAAVTYAATKR